MARKKHVVMAQGCWVPPSRSAVFFNAIILAQLDGPAAFVGDGDDVPGVLQVASADLVQAAQVSTACRLSLRSLGQLRFMRGGTQVLAPCCRFKSDQFPALRPCRWIVSSFSLSLRGADSVFGGGPMLFTPIALVLSQSECFNLTSLRVNGSL